MPQIGSNTNIEDVTANFTDNQWYCHLARQTVFFSAFSDRNFTKEDGYKIAREIIKLAPHVLGKSTTLSTGSSLDEAMLEQIVSLEKVSNLQGFPDRWSMAGSDIFEQTDIAPFRIKIAILENGPDEKGRFAAILILSTHAMFEGVDAATLARSRSVKRGAVTKRPEPISRVKKAGFTFLAAILAPLQLLAAALLAPRVADVKFKSLVIERNRLRQAANRLGIRQQSLIFALASFALNDGGTVFSKKSISSLYADLSKTENFKTNDDFFQFRMIDLNLPVMDDFSDFARSVEQELTKAEEGDKNHTQTLLNAMFGMHRRLHSLFPFLYNAQLFRYSAGYDFSLSLAPPQRLEGKLTDGLIEPVFTGTYHPGFNTCVFVPGRKFVTFNFSLRAKHIKNLENIPYLLEQLEQS